MADHTYTAIIKIENEFNNLVVLVKIIIKQEKISKLRRNEKKPSFCDDLQPLLLTNPLIVYEWLSQLCCRIYISILFSKGEYNILLILLVAYDRFRSGFVFIK